MRNTVSTGRAAASGGWRVLVLLALLALLHAALTPSSPITRPPMPTAARPGPTLPPYRARPRGPASPRGRCWRRPEAAESTPGSGVRRLCDASACHLRHQVPTGSGGKALGNSPVEQTLTTSKDVSSAAAVTAAAPACHHAWPSCAAEPTRPYSPIPSRHGTLGRSRPAVVSSRHFHRRRSGMPLDVFAALGALVRAELVRNKPRSPRADPPTTPLPQRRPSRRPRRRRSAADRPPPATAPAAAPPPARPGPALQDDPEAGRALQVGRMRPGARRTRPPAARSRDGTPARHACRHGLRSADRPRAHRLSVSPVDAILGAMAPVAGPDPVSGWAVRHPGPMASGPLAPVRRPAPEPGPDDLLLRVRGLRGVPYGSASGGGRPAPAPARRPYRATRSSAAWSPPARR